MLRKIINFFLPAIVIAGMTGCARQIIVAEALQQPLGSKVYLKHNVWYKNPKEISCLNMQEGKIIPFGTEVEPVKVTDDMLAFRTPDGKIFVIRYDYSYIMLPMDAFVQRVFTLKTRAEMTKGMKPEIVKSMLEGKIKRGMTKDQVALTMGLPPACRTPSRLNNTWLYWLDKESVYRVVFRRGKVNTIVNINDKPKW